MSFDLWLQQSKPLMPVIVLHETRHAVPLAKALLAGGVKFLEVTLRTKVGLECIRILRDQMPEAIVGAGTITNTDDLKQAQDAGAMFAISPGISPALCEEARALDMPYMPGVMAPSDIMVGLEYGIQGFKFYPAEAAGGVSMLKALGGPFADVWFCPTGGISPTNYSNYLAQPNVRLVGGSWVCADSLVQQADWLSIEKLSADFKGD